MSPVENIIKSPLEGEINATSDLFQYIGNKFDEFPDRIALVSIISF